MQPYIVKQKQKLIFKIFSPSGVAVCCTYNRKEKNEPVVRWCRVQIIEATSC